MTGRSKAAGKTGSITGITGKRKAVKRLRIISKRKKRIRKISRNNKGINDAGTDCLKTMVFRQFFYSLFDGFT
jgi:hypothetical protein